MGKCISKTSIKFREYSKVKTINWIYDLNHGMRESSSDSEEDFG